MKYLRGITIAYYFSIIIIIIVIIIIIILLLLWMLHVLRHDEWRWHWQKGATLYNQENDKYSH